MDPTATIAGGGMAAVAACLALAARGVPVTWIAPPATSGDRPGESLAAAARPLLQRLGLDDLLDDPAHRPVAASFTSWGSDALLESDALARPGGMGHVVHRGRLEAAMVARLRRQPRVTGIAGQVTGIARRAGGWTVSTDTGENVQAGVLIDATGRACRIGRRLAKLQRGDRLMAAYAFLEQVDREVEPTPATLVEAVATGWWYATLLADGRLALNHYSDPDLLPRGLGRDPAAWQALAADSRYISRWIESAGFALAGAPRLASAGTAWLSRAAGPDWAAVGDAAAAFDPLSAHGMTTALWTGIEAGEAAGRALDGDPGPLRHYADRVDQGIARYRDERLRIYRREGRFAGQPFWQRRRTAAEGVQDVSTEPRRSSIGRAFTQRRKS